MSNERTANTEAMKNLESLSNYLYEEIVKTINIDDLNDRTKDYLMNAKMQVKELRKTLGDTYVWELTGKELDVNIRDIHSYKNMKSLDLRPNSRNK